MKLLLDDNGNVVVRNGKPVYVKDDGTEVEFDAAGTVGTIARLNGEAKTHREGKEAEATRAAGLADALKVFEGLDPKAAKEALAKLKNIDDGKLLDSGKVEEVRAAAIKAFEEKMTAVTAAHTTTLTAEQEKNKKLTSALHSELIGGGFARSKLIAEKLAIPADLVQAKFGSAFQVEDGKVIALDSNGQKMYSPARPGEIANFDEALEMLVNQYPHKDHILKASGASGSGASGSAVGAAGSKKAMPRGEFDALTPAAKQAHLATGAGLTD